MLNLDYFNINTSSKILFSLLNIAMKELRKSPETGLYLSIPQQNVSHRYSANIASPNASIHSKISETYVDFKNNLKVRYIARA